MAGCVSKFKLAIWIACLVIGIATTAEGAAVTLAWNPNTEPDIEGYRISYGTASGQYITSVDVGNNTTHTLSNLFAGQTYYFVLQAINAAGPSPYSNEVSATLTSPLTVMNLAANRTSPQPAATTITFSATANGGTPPYQYKWWILAGTTQTVGSNWSTNSSFAWTPTVANPNYTIRVWARNASSTADVPDNPAATLEMSFAITSTGGATNQAPTVNAGADQNITLPSSASLSATVSDDGLPTGTLTRTWTRASGPGTVTFGAPNAAATNASFSVAGTYVLRLTASDGALSTADELAVTVAPNVPSSGGLVAAFGFDEGSGPTTVDASGNANTGTMAGGTTWMATGKFGGALQFNGSTSGVTVPDAPVLDLTTGMTLEAWVFPTIAPTGWRGVVGKDVDRYYVMASGSSNTPTVGGTWVSGNQNLSAAGALPINTWSHLAATSDGTTVRLYVNGVQVASRPETTALTTSNGALTIGHNFYGERFTGRIDEVRIYNRALTATQIQSDMATPVSSIPGGPDTTPPTAPSTLTATASGTQIALNWTAATDNVGVTGYRIERCQGAGCSSFAQIATTTGATTFTNTALVAGTSYAYRVRATDAATLLGPYSNIAAATTPAAVDTTPPTAPGALTATASGTQIALNWTAATDNVGVTGYRIERCQGAGCSSFAQIATTTGATSYTNTALAVGTSYAYRVRATDAASLLGPYSNIATATTPATVDTTPPTAPGTLTATASGTQIALSWSAATDNVGVTGYRIERCQGAGCSSFAQIATTTGATSYTNTALASAASYSYRVRATDAATLLGPYSNTASASTPSATGGPTGLIAGYTFNAGSGTTAVDSSGNGITGTLSGATWTAAGRYGNALSFNGANAYVNLGNTTALQGTGSTTWAAWVFATGVPWDDGQIVAKSDNSSGWQLKTSPDTGPHTFAIAISGSGGSHTQRYSTTVRALNTWYHVAGVYNAAARTLDIYVNGVLNNGVLLGTVPAAQVVPNVNVNIGRRTNGFHFQGVIDDVRIYNRALAPAEISQISQ